MKKLLFTFLLFQFFGLNAQDSLYSRVYFDPLTNLDEKSVIAAPDGGVLITSHYDWYKSVVSRLDSLGNELWSKHFFEPSQIQLNCAAFAADTGYYLGGGLMNSVNSTYEAICIKLNSSGDTLWKRSFGTSSLHPTRITSIAATPDSGAVFIGNMSLDQHFIARLDKDGNMLWSHIYSVPNTIESKTVRCLEDSSILLGGYLWDPSNGYEGLLMHFSENGVNDWSKTFNGKQIKDIELQPGGAVCLFMDILNYQTGTFVIDETGAISDGKIYAGFYLNEYSDLEILSNGSKVFVTGDQVNGCSVFKTDSNYIPEVSKHIMMAGNSAVEGVNNSIFITGTGPMYGLKSVLTQTHIGFVRADSNLNIYSDIFSCNWTQNNPSVSNFTASGSNYTANELSSLSLGALPIQYEGFDVMGYFGCVDFLGGIDENAFAEELKVYPNASSGVFHFDQLSAEEIQIVIYSPNGQKIQTVTSSSLSTEIDLSAVGQGIYFYRVVRTDQQRAGGKLVVLN
jgi:hypothetical protein